MQVQKTRLGPSRTLNVLTPPCSHTHTEIHSGKVGSSRAFGYTNNAPTAKSTVHKVPSTHHGIASSTGTQTTQVIS